MPLANCMSSNPRPHDFFGFFTAKAIQGHYVVDDLGKVIGRSRTLLGPFVVRRLSQGPLSPPVAVTQVAQVCASDDDESGGFQAVDEQLMTEAFGRASAAAKGLGANAVIGLRLERKESGCFVVTGRAVYLAPLTPESPTAYLSVLDSYKH